MTVFLIVVPLYSHLWFHWEIEVYQLGLEFLLLAQPHFLTLSFVFERLAALVGCAAVAFAAALQRFMEAVDPAERRLQAAAPKCRLRTRPSHQVLHPHHHLPGHCQDLILKHTKKLVPQSDHHLFRGFSKDMNYICILII